MSGWFYQSEFLAALPLVGSDQGWGSASHRFKLIGLNSAPAEDIACHTLITSNPRSHLTIPQLIPLPSSCGIIPLIRTPKRDHDEWLG